uniref:uncharacterized protein LOC120330388 n=1 Tax=Styela clava TaxID=7725 RepID=UPI00193AAC97|nr:uncharacterized protein LOC120330388 [Styela clava]
MSTVKEDAEITTQPHEYQSKHSPVTTSTALATISQTNLLSTTNLSLLTTIAETSHHAKEYESENPPVTTSNAIATISQTNLLSTTSLSHLTTIADTTRYEKVELSTTQITTSTAIATISQTNLWSTTDLSLLTTIAETAVAETTRSEKLELTTTQKYESENSPVTTSTAFATISQTNLLSTTDLSLLTTIAETTIAETAVAETTRSEKLELTTTQRICGVIYNSKCYKAIVQYAGNLAFSDAKNMCNLRLANIYDVTQFDMLLQYMRTLITNDSTALAVHTGMYYKRGEFELSNGEPVTLPSSVWQDGYPNSTGSYTNIAINVDRNPNSKHQGIQNHSPNGKQYGAICEYKF